MAGVRRGLRPQTVGVSIEHVSQHAAQHRQPALERVQVAAVVVGPRRVGQKDADVERRLHLVLRVVGEVAVRQHVGVKVVLEIGLDLGREVPELLRPHELVMRHREERVAALRNLRVGAFAHLVARLEAAIAAPREDDAGAGGVREPGVGDVDAHPRIEEVAPVGPDIQQRREERGRGAVPVAIDPPRRRQALIGVRVARRNEAAGGGFRQERAHAVDGVGVGAPRQHHHHFVADVEMRVPDADVRRGQVAANERALAVARDVLVEVLRRQQPPWIEEPASEVRRPRRLRIRLHFTRCAIGLEIERALGAGFLVGHERPADEFVAQGRDVLVAGIFIRAEDVIAGLVGLRREGCRPREAVAGRGRDRPRPDVRQVADALRDARDLASFVDVDDHAAVRDVPLDTAVSAPFGPVNTQTRRQPSSSSPTAIDVDAPPADWTTADPGWMRVTRGVSASAFASPGRRREYSFGMRTGG